jgi:hypothetical protein
MFMSDILLCVVLFTLVPPSPSFGPNFLVSPRLADLYVA